MRPFLLCLLVSGCAVDTRPDAPLMQLEMWQDQPELDEYRNGALIWAPLGFDVVDDTDLPECDRRWYDEPRTTDCVLTIGVKRDPLLRERDGTDALANRAERYIAIDSELTGAYELTLAVAHELGHIVLDTDRHTQGGLMGGASAKIEQADYELACDVVGLCVR